MLSTFNPNDIGQLVLISGFLAMILILLIGLFSEKSPDKNIQ